MEEVKCSNCNGACCRFIKLPLTVHLSEDTKRWLELHKSIVVTNTHIFVFNKCKNLEDNKCKDYENRPNVCKNYKVGGSECLRARIIIKK